MEEEAKAIMEEEWEGAAGGGPSGSSGGPLPGTRLAFGNPLDYLPAAAEEEQAGSFREFVRHVEAFRSFTREGREFQDIDTDQLMPYATYFTTRPHPFVRQRHLRMARVFVQAFYERRYNITVQQTTRVTGTHVQTTPTTVNLVPLGRERLRQIIDAITADMLLAHGEGELANMQRLAMTDIRRQVRRALAHISDEASSPQSEQQQAASGAKKQT